MTHLERKDRRQRIALAVKEGLTLQEAVLEFGTSINIVRLACIEYGVPWRDGRNWLPMVHSFGVLKALLSGLSDSAAAKEFSLSRQRIHQIRKCAIAAGFAQLARV